VMRMYVHMHMYVSRWPPSGSDAHVCAYAYAYVCVKVASQRVVSHTWAERSNAVATMRDDDTIVEVLRSAAEKLWGKHVWGARLSRMNSDWISWLIARGTDTDLMAHSEGTMA